MRSSLQDNPARVQSSPDALSRIDAAWRSQFDTTLGRFGAPFHVVLAMFACACIAGPQSALELGVLPLLVCWVLRWPFVFRGLSHVLASPVTLAFFALLAWSVLALLWSPNTDAALLELRYWRWGWLLLALWPVLHARRLLIASLAVGFLFAHGAQVVDALAAMRGETIFSHPPTTTPLERLSGWWYHPVHGGVMLAAAFGLHIGPAMCGVGKVRVIGVLGASLALLGVIATGTRGAFLACCVLAGVVLCALALTGGRAWYRQWREWRGSLHAPQRHAAKSASGRMSFAPGLLVVGSLIIACAVSIMIAPGMANRVRTGTAELRLAWQGNVNSDMGARVVALRSAFDAWQSHPVRGLGLHAFGAHTQAFVEREKIALPPERVAVLRTAHNTPAHMLASLGSIGLVLWCVLAASVVWSGWHIAREKSIRATLGTYDIAPMLAACGMLIAGQFDTLGLNSPTAALATLLCALCVRGAREVHTRNA